MTTQPTTLPDRAAAHAMERARLDALRASIAQVLSADMAQLNRCLAAGTAPQTAVGGAA